MDVVNNQDPISSSLINIMATYEDAVKQPFSGKTNVHQEFKNVIGRLKESEKLKNSNNLSPEFSCGKGNWTSLPHIEVLDTRRTKSVQRGIYIVFLFKEDMSGFYLTLNQGVTEPIKRLERKKGYEFLLKISSNVRNSIPENKKSALQKQGFSLDNDIFLSESQTGRDYRQSTIAQKYFSKDSNFTDAELLDDLSLLIDVYLNLPKEEDFKPTPAQNYWIFQANPKIYDLGRAINTLRELPYTVNNHKDQIKIGDQVFLWVSGEKSGVIGRATVMSKPEVMPEAEDSKQFYVSPENFNDNKVRVKLRVDKALAEPLTRDEIKKYPELYDLSIIRNAQGTNFAVTLTEANFLMSLMQESRKLPAIQAKLGVTQFFSDLQSANLYFDEGFILRFVAAICTKPFTILTGLSGSGKTKLALAFAKWISKDDEQICVVPVGADWTNREPLLGFPNALEPGRYVKPDTGVLDFLIRATKYPALPHFLILDEMNLSHVERYFADFLSGIESSEPILLRPNVSSWQDSDVPASLILPKNLFIVGTVNVDETTYMFSPKVLDRAGVLEFRVTTEEMKRYFEVPQSPRMSELEHKGSSMSNDFLRLATTDSSTYAASQELTTILMQFFVELQKLGAEFGYRTAFELFRFGSVASELTKDEKYLKKEFIVDAGILQKLLPKVHGSRRKLEGLLKILIGLCLVDGTSENIQKYTKNDRNSYVDDKNVKYPLSLEKLIRMHNHVIQDGFTSFSEA